MLGNISHITYYVLLCVVRLVYHFIYYLNIKFCYVVYVTSNKTKTSLCSQYVTNVDVNKALMCIICTH